MFYCLSFEVRKVLRAIDVLAFTISPFFSWWMFSDMALASAVVFFESLSSFAL